MPTTCMNESSSLSSNMSLSCPKLVCDITTLHHSITLQCGRVNLKRLSYKKKLMLVLPLCDGGLRRRPLSPASGLFRGRKIEYSALVAKLLHDQSPTLGKAEWSILLDSSSLLLLLLLPLHFLWQTMRALLTTRRKFQIVIGDLQLSFDIIYHGLVQLSLKQASSDPP